MPDHEPQITFSIDTQIEAAKLAERYGMATLSDAILQNLRAHQALADRYLVSETDRRELKAHRARHGGTVVSLPATRSAVIGHIDPNSPEAA